MECDDPFSQLALDAGQRSPDQRAAYMARLDTVAHSDEVAYEFFRYCVGLDLSGFRVQQIPSTEP
eukprot:11032375-Alexandrium_andersonii.AAC.1